MHNENPEVRQFIKSIRKSRSGYMISMSYGLHQHVPLCERQDICGFDLGTLVDWYNSAYFDTRHNMISEHLRASRPIMQIKRAVGYWEIHKEIAIAYVRDFWLKKLAQSLAIRVGNGIAALEKPNGKQYMNAQHFLWPTRRTDELLAQELGREKVKELDSYRQ